MPDPGIRCLESEMAPEPWSIAERGGAKQLLGILKEKLPDEGRRKGVLPFQSAPERGRVMYLTGTTALASIDHDFNLTLHCDVHVSELFPGCKPVNVRPCTYYARIT